ncbi:MAG: hypothetical protein K2Y37_18625 [Pirellulales bacterium]|nr:hypothetical protein [Pirellulales bacterium]
MFVNLEVADRDLVIGLVQSRLSELPGELRRTEAQHYHDELKREQEALVGLLHRLQASEWDVNA